MIKNLSDINSIRLYLERIGASPKNIRTAVIEKTHGKYYEEVDTIKFDNDGTVTCSNFDLRPTPEELDEIERECKLAVWPKVVIQKNIVNPPKDFAETEPSKYFEFRDTNGGLIMVQIRKDGPDHVKKYISWTFYDDGEWRPLEPDFKLPLWGLPQIKENKTVFIHEGAKAARFCSELCADEKRLNDHPWGKQISAAAHLGWIAGAQNPRKTDWTWLSRNGVNSVYIIADNDSQGKSAITKISSEIDENISVYSVEFTDRFPASFDLADPFPENGFVLLDDKKQKVWIGETFDELKQPATFATVCHTTIEKYINKAGEEKERLKNNYVISSAFRKMWNYIDEIEVFICSAKPDIMHSDTQFRRYVRAFTHSGVDAADKFLASYKGRTYSVAYRPDIPERLITNATKPTINVFKGSEIQRVHGDVTPWLNFMKYLVPDDDERQQMFRWIATLVAKPETILKYSTLLISETQGTGKTTLCQKILAPLVGVWNCSNPDESQVMSDYTTWIAKKRLVIVSEIFEGHSWLMYKKLKSKIGTQDIDVNEKYMKSYVIRNYATIIACSNERKALKIENTDRRWFIPTVTEEKWNEREFSDFYMWVERGGLEKIMDWCHTFGDYVRNGETAPITKLKLNLIDESESEVLQRISEVLVPLKDGKFAFYDEDMRDYLRRTVKNGSLESKNNVGKKIAKCGFGDKIKVHENGKMKFAYFSKQIFDEISEIEFGKPDIVRKYLKSIDELTNL